MKIKLLTICGAVALAVTTAQAASISYSLTAPTPGAADIYNFAGAGRDGLNVSDSGAYLDGAPNDASTYIAFDRGAQGQTFTTGSFLAGYTISAIWLEHVGYTTNGTADYRDGGYNGTWYMDPAGSHFQIRLTDPSQSGNAGFVLGTEVATTTGSEANSLPTGLSSSDNGTGIWLRFGFSTPLTLSANTTYGFDVSSPNSYGGFGTQPFFETLGTMDDVLGGGAAYSSGANGSGGDNILTARVGDRVFLVELTPVPEPSTFALIGLGGLALLLRRRSA